MYLNRKGIQFGYRDSWGVDHSLAPIIVAWLKNFKKVITRDECPGVPCVYFTQDELDEGPKDEAFKEAKKKQLAELDEMIWAFEQDDEFPDDCWLEEPDWMGSGKITGINLGTGRLDWDKINAYRDRLHKGRMLFVERYSTLWW